jgi:hypothetical protein
MKPGTVLAVSAVLNFALVVAVLVLLNSRPVVAPPKIIKETVTNTVVRGATKRSDGANVTLSSNIWRAVESGDYRAYISNLHAIGCPDETIRDIIITDLNKLYTSKARTLNPALKNNKFWQPDPASDDPKQREFQRQLNQLEKEKRETTRALLGADYQAEMAKQSVFPTYPEQQETAQQNVEQELKTLMDERYAEYQRTQDGAYRELLQVAQTNNLPKETVHAVYDMKKTAEEQHRLVLANEELTAEQKNAALIALRDATEKAIKEVMGEKAFKDYQRRGGNWMLNLSAQEQK